MVSAGKKYSKLTVRITCCRRMFFLKSGAPEGLGKPVTSGQNWDFCQAQIFLGSVGGARSSHLVRLFSQIFVSTFPECARRI